MRSKKVQYFFSISQNSVFLQPALPILLLIQKNIEDIAKTVHSHVEEKSNIFKWASLPLVAIGFTSYGKSYFIFALETNSFILFILMS